MIGLGWSLSHKCDNPLGCESLCCKEMQRDMCFWLHWCVVWWGQSVSAPDMFFQGFYWILAYVFFFQILTWVSNSYWTIHATFFLVITSKFVYDSYEYGGVRRYGSKVFKTMNLHTNPIGLTSGLKQPTRNDAHFSRLTALKNHAGTTTPWSFQPRQCRDSAWQPGNCRRKERRSRKTWWKTNEIRLIEQLFIIQPGEWQHIWIHDVMAQADVFRWVC